MSERWLPLTGFNGYHVSDHGRISTPRGHVMTPTLSWRARGYAQVVIRRNDGKAMAVRIHRAVATAFLGLVEGADVNHIDGDKTNNHVTNLEWCTRSENIKHAFRTGLSHVAGLPGAANGRAVLTEANVIEIRRLKGSVSLEALAKRYGVSKSTVGMAQRGQTWKELAL